MNLDLRKNLYLMPAFLRISFVCIISSLCSLSTSFANDKGLFKSNDAPSAEVKAPEENKPAVPQPITINGDRVEYSTDSKEISIEGHAEVIYKGTKLSCDKLSVNSQTKEAVAEGNARLDQKDGVLIGDRIVYNFESKKGTLVDAGFRSNPFFGKAKRLEKVSESEFVASRGYMTTCSYDNPHWRMKSKKMDMFPGDKVKLIDNRVYFGKIPALCLPQYTQNLKDPIMHVQVMPGNSKNWGMYTLSAWWYQLAENISGRVYFDVRSKLGVAEGIGTTYTTSDYGKGDFKFYYTQERDKTGKLPNAEDVNTPKVFERYFLRARHKWDIDEQTKLTLEYYKITDSKMALFPGQGYNFLKEYFFREYEKDTQPLSYGLFHHSFSNSSMDILMQLRTNRWYTQDEKLPEIKYSLPGLQIGNSPFYFQNDSSFVNFATKIGTGTSGGWSGTTAYHKIDTLNKFSLPMKVSIFNFTPFLAGQDIYNTKPSTGTTYGATQNYIFSTGADISTKFFRLFNAKTNFLNLNINGLRHVITPTASYSYAYDSTMPAGTAWFGGGGTLGRQSVALGLTNKLQTKRNGQSVDLLDLDITNTYLIKAKTDLNEGALPDFLFKLKLIPYSWLRLESDATYKHSGNRSEPSYNHFSNVNYDVNFDFGKERSLGVGQRYFHKGTDFITLNLDWRFNPKWKFGLYLSTNKGHDPTYKRGLREQQYSIIRDLHCWSMELNYNVKKGGLNSVNAGETIWLVFRLKAFPELEFGYDQSYHAPKTGTQSNP